MSSAEIAPASREEIVSYLGAHDLRYQRIELPYGLATPGPDRSATAELVFPEKLTGESVLDVGSYLGYFCQEASRRGAARVVGVDLDPERLEQARVLARFAGRDIEFRRLDVEREEIGERFDLVLLLNVIHHVRDPAALLRRLGRVAQRRLALEVPGLGDPEMARHLAKEYGLRPRHIRKLERLPLLGAAPSGVAQGAFFFTPAALRTVLLDHGREFARVDVVASPKSERFVAIAHKRRIGELVVVAGPSGAGKSVLMDLLAREPELARRLGVEDPASWQSVPAAQLRKLEEPEVPRLLLHYDLMRTARDGARTFERDSALDVIACAERVRVYTLVCEPRELSRRLSGRPPKSEGLRAQMQRDLAFHARPQALEDLYRGWEAFCRERELANTWIENGGGRPHFCEGSGFPGFGA